MELVDLQALRRQLFDLGHNLGALKIGDVTAVFTGVYLIITVGEGTGKADILNSTAPFSHFRVLVAST